MNSKWFFSSWLSPSSSSNSNLGYLIYVHPFEERNLIIQNLLTWKTQTIRIGFSLYSDANYFLLSPDETQLAMTIMHWDHEMEREVYSVGIINLETGLQKKIITVEDEWDVYYPLRWENNDSVLLTTDWAYPERAQFFSLNVHTARLTEMVNP